MLHNAAWHLYQAPNAADPTTLLNSATRHITSFYEITEKTPADEALTLLLSALIAAEGPDFDEALVLANQAEKLSADTVQEFLYGRVYLDGNYLTENWNPRFQAWLDYSTEKTKFTLVNATQCPVSSFG